MIRKIKYSYGDRGQIILPEGAPFDGKPVLINTAEGWCEAYWEPWSPGPYEYPDDGDGFCFIPMNDKLDHVMIDDVKEWHPLPKHRKSK